MGRLPHFNLGADRRRTGRSEGGSPARGAKPPRRPRDLYARVRRRASWRREEPAGVDGRRPQPEGPSPDQRFCARRADRLGRCPRLLRRSLGYVHAAIVVRRCSLAMRSRPSPAEVRDQLVAVLGTFSRDRAPCHQRLSQRPLFRQTSSYGDTHRPYSATGTAPLSAGDHKAPGSGAREACPVVVRLLRQPV